MAPAPIRIRAAEAISTVSGNLLEASKVLLARDDNKDDDKNDRHKPTVDPDSGSFDPHDISNAGFFFLFALIGVAFVAGGIWFFFWAKNGGFQFRETDWDDYKSTVLRRTGPNGTILSNATRPTNLGGGSVYKDVADDDSHNNHNDHNDDGQTVITEATGLSGITAGASDLYSRDKRRRKQEKRDRERVKKGKKPKHRFVGEDGVEDEDAERSAKKELRNYRHERPARVGGLNKESEGSQWDGSTNPTESNVSTTLLSDRQTTPTTTPTKPSGGIRKVYSVADRRADREQERMRAEARRLREAGRAARRDYSYQRAESYTRAESQASESLLDGSQVTRTTGDSTSDLGTKSYHHPMPELRELERERAREERRARRAERGYRRSRQEEVD